MAVAAPAVAVVVLLALCRRRRRAAAAALVSGFLSASNLRLTKSRLYCYRVIGAQLQRRVICLDRLGHF